uniref:Candidate secreted effector n=1 Tax=Meloidogyne incognita TaxID=6306 RepID=A0A914LZM2_MELIC
MQIYVLLQFIVNFNFIMLLIVPLGSFAESPPVFPTEEAAEDECCMDDGRLVDTSFAGALAALIIIFLWHIFRIFCISRMAAAHHPPSKLPPQPKESSSSSTNVDSSPLLLSKQYVLEVREVPECGEGGGGKK